MWPYPEFREKQKEVINVIEKSLRNRKIVGLNAPTGFGKTIVVLYSIARFFKENEDKKCLYVVRTKNEVRPVLKELYMLKSRAAWINYTFLIAKKDMCLHRLRTSQELKLPSEDFIETCRDFRSKNLCPLKRIEPKPFSKISEFLEIAMEEEACPWYACKYMFDEAHFIVATYPYLFNPYIRQSVFSYDVGVLHLKDAVIVVDEAHNLESVIQSSDRGLSAKTVERSLSELDKYSHAVPAILQEACREYLYILLNFMEKYRGAKRYLRLNADYFYGEVVDRINLDILGEASDIIRGIKVEMHGLKARSFLRSVWRFLHYFDIMYTLHYEDIGVFALGDRIEVKMLNPAIATALLNEAYTAILMSGTLPPLDYLRDVYGLKREIEYVKVGDIFPPENKRYFCAANVTTKYRVRGSEVYKKLAYYILYIRARIPSEYIVLTVYPSYEVMSKVLSIYEKAKEKIEEKIFDIVERENTKIDEVAEKIGQLSERVVIHAVAGGKLTEGIELTRDGASLIGAVIVAGLPFPEPNDYLEAYLARMSELYGKEKGWEYVVLIPTLIKVKQAFGRAIRGPKDKASFFILDRRALSKKILELLDIKPTIISLPSRLLA